MPSTRVAIFTFATGNVDKLLRLPLYALGAVASAVVPRSTNRWVFGCGSGLGEGSLALLQYTRSHNPGMRIDWLARNQSDLDAAAALGIRATLKDSGRGFWLTLRARVVVVTHGFGDANRYASRGAVVVQLWHGIPLKLIQLDSPATLRVPIPIVGGQVRGLLRRFYRRGLSSIDVLPAASELVASRLRSAFHLTTDRVPVTGDPRDDVLSAGSPDERRSVSRALLFDRLGTDAVPRVLLFAPTWRDGEADPSIPTAAEWTRTDAWLREHDAVLVVRPHPLGVGDYATGPATSDRIHLLTSAQQSDVNPILSAVDALVTDYSSIAFDYSLTGGPILYIAPDQDSYTRSRGLYEAYREFSGGREVRSWSAILDQLERLDADAAFAAAVHSHAVAVADRHFAFRDGRNTARVYARIVERVKALK